MLRRSLFKGCRRIHTRFRVSPALPVKGELVVDQYEVCLNNARWHPMSRGAKQAVVQYLEYKARGVWTPPAGLNSPESILVRKAFADLIGEAIPKGMPTWVHGLSQQIISELLKGAGYIAASEVELRIDPDARPRPDIVATRTVPANRYPTTGLEVAVEIISDDDKYPVNPQRCRKYQQWGFGASGRPVRSFCCAVERWGYLAELATVPVQQIWAELDKQYSGN